MAQQDAIKSVIDSDPDEEDPWGPDEDDDDDCSGIPHTTKIICCSRYSQIRSNFPGQDQ